LLDTDFGEDSHATSVLALPGSESILFGACVRPCNRGDRILALDIASGAVHEVVSDGSEPVFATRDLLVYSREDDVFVVGFDARTVETRGDAVPVLLDVGVQYAARVAVAQSGHLVYHPAASVSGGDLVAVDRQGLERPLSVESAPYGTPRYSPTGDRIAFTYAPPNVPSQIWIYDLTTLAMTPFTAGDGSSRPTWSPNGEELGFQSLVDGLWSVHRQPLDRSQPARRAEGATPSTLSVSPVWSPDGRWILADQFEAGGGEGDDIVAFPLNAEDSLVVILATEFVETVPDVSPDGRWLAYVSTETGREEVYVRPFMRPGGRVAISTNGADMPLWVSDTEMVFLDQGTDLMLVQFEDGRPTVQQRLFSVRGYEIATNVPSYDVSPDGQEFVFILSEAATPPIIVINWLEEARQLLGEETRRE